jgi:hypothetical protein
VEHLGFIVEAVRESFGVPVLKVRRVTDKATQLLKLVSMNRRMVEHKLVESFVGTVSSLSLAVPEGPFFLRRLQDCLSTRPDSGGSRVPFPPTLYGTRGSGCGCPMGQSRTSNIGGTS